MEPASNSNILLPILAFAFVFLLCSEQGTGTGTGTGHGGGFAMVMTERNRVKATIGAIVDYDSRIGREEKVAMEMAIEDFYHRTNHNLSLQVQNSHGEPVQAALAAAHLIKAQRVQAILGPRTWEEASLVAEIGTQFQTPILSFADSAPWATTRWPFLVQATPSHYAQMKAVAAIVQSWGWRRVVVIYEDIDSAANGITPHLYDSLQDVGTEISRLVPLQPFDSPSLLSQELEKLKTEQCRVFLVHAYSLPLTIRLFELAKKMEMMGKDYVWITTDPVTSLVHALNSSVIASMQGILGVKTYFLETGPRFLGFSARFSRRFGLENPEEKNHEPGIFALQAYDAATAVALAVAEGGEKRGDLLDKISSSDFDGLSGKVVFTERKSSPARRFQIINVIGKSYKEIGFWSEGYGFSWGVDGREAYNDSMEKLGQVVWPGEPRSTPKGWNLSTSTSKLKVAVPKGLMFNLFTKVGYDQLTKNRTFSGFAVDVFKAIVARLPYDFPYDFVLCEDTFDAMLEQVYLKNFDAAIGGIAITSERYNKIDFSQPHTDTALTMVVPVQSLLNNKAWMFLKPFTNAMWALTAFINVYNGFVVWMIERDHCSDLRGSLLNQLGTLLWLAFATLFSLQGEKLHSNLSRMATVVWLFVALVITQSYTANLTSMLTVHRLEPTVVDIDTLKYNKAMVGSLNKSFVANYLTGVLNFSSDSMKSYYTTPEEIAQALRSKEIAAVFLEAPIAKVFLSRYCKSFISAGPTFKIGGYGFAFQKGSPMVSDINEALLQVIESGKLRELANSVMATESCVDVTSDNDDVSLSPHSFSVLFILTGATSTVALVVFAILSKPKLDDSMHEHRTIWMLMFRVIQCLLLRRKRFSRKVSDSAESPTSAPPPNASESWNPV